VFDFVIEFLLDAVGELFESGADAAAEVTAEATADIAPGTAFDPGAALAAPVDAGGSATPFMFDDHPISATLRSAGFSGPV
jgi:hypothetical protein